MLLTIDDLRTSKNQTGFKGVQRVGGQPSRGAQPVYYQGLVYLADGQRKVFPGRQTPEEAAQDIVDWRLGNPSVPSEPRGRGGVRLAGHSHDGVVDPIPSDIEAAYGMIRDYRAQQAGKPGYVYLIIEDTPGAMFGKVGYSVNPQKRVSELQTGNPRPLKLYATRLGTLEDEVAIHREHIADNVLQEWFRLTPSLLSKFPEPQEANS